MSQFISLSSLCRLVAQQLHNRLHDLLEGWMRTQPQEFDRRTLLFRYMQHSRHQLARLHTLVVFLLHIFVVRIGHFGGFPSRCKCFDIIDNFN